jgi:Piwi domain
VAMHKLVLNATRVAIPKTKIAVGRLPYDESHLEKLRRDDAGALLVQRQDDSMVAISLLPDRKAPGSPSEIDLSTLPRLAAVLARESLLRFLHHAVGYSILSRRPLRVIGEKPANLVHPDYELPDWIEKRLVMRFDTRVLYREAETPQVILLCDVGTRNSLGASCADLHKLGVPLIGRYVSIQEAAFDPRLEDYRKIVGRIIDVENGIVHLEDYAEGYSSVRAEDVSLEPRRENWNLCIEALLGARAEKVIDAIENDVAQIRQGDARLNLIRKTLTFLGNQRLEFVPGMVMQLAPMFSEAGRSWSFPTKTLERPPLVFSPSGGQTGTWAQGTLDQLGPYDQRDFTPKTPRIALICQDKYQGETSRCVGAFLDGIPDAVIPGRSSFPPTAPFQNGFIGRFRLTKSIVDTFTATDETAGAYEDACRRALDAASDRGFTWDLAIVQTESEFRLLPNARNPYFVTKAMLLKRGIQVQAITLSTMRLPKIGLAYSLSNASLASYAKLGGVPWLLPSQPNTDHELVIGLGSHTEKVSRLGAGTRTVGITTVFTSDGRYILEDRTAAVPFDEYPAALKESLLRTISRIRRENNWRSSDAVRLVFHVFKPLRDREVETVESTIKALGLENVRFAFIHIVDDHPFQLFDETNSGSRYKDPKNGLVTKKGIFAPDRGIAVEISDSEVLVVMKGSKEIKLPQQGTPKPILLRLHAKSTFRDLGYLTAQMFDFSCHSWRTFYPASLPVSILYSELIAEMLAGLSGVPGWDSDAMRSSAGRTRWFL